MTAPVESMRHRRYRRITSVLLVTHQLIYGGFPERDFRGMTADCTSPGCAFFVPRCDRTPSCSPVIINTQNAISIDRFLSIIMRIGFIGLGLMGTPLAINILKGGFELTVWNSTGAKTEPLLTAGRPGREHRPTGSVVRCGYHHAHRRRGIGIRGLRQGRRS
jgi:hypothetical protein